MAYVSEPPIACSLSRREQVERAAEARELIDSALVARERSAGGLRLRFRGPPAVHSAVRALARREKECCPFFDFELVESGEDLEMTVTAPAEAQPLLDSLFSGPSPTAAGRPEVAAAPETDRE